MGSPFPCYQPCTRQAGSWERVAGGARATGRGEGGFGGGVSGTEGHGVAGGEKGEGGLFGAEEGGRVGHGQRGVEGSEYSGGDGSECLGRGRDRSGDEDARSDDRGCEVELAMCRWSNPA